MFIGPGDKVVRFRSPPHKGTNRHIIDIESRYHLGAYLGSTSLIHHLADTQPNALLIDNHHPVNSYGMVL